MQDPNIESFVPCPHCLRENLDPPHMFPLSECDRAMREGEFELTCGRDRSFDVRIDSLLPSMDEGVTSGVRKTTMDKIENMEEVGRGTFAKVMKGVLDGQMVAVKIMHLEDNNALELSSDFYKEVWLMSCMRHMNLVQLVAVVEVSERR